MSCGQCEASDHDEGDPNLPDHRINYALLGEPPRFPSASHPPRNDYLPTASNGVYPTLYISQDENEPHDKRHTECISESSHSLKLTQDTILFTYNGDLNRESPSSEVTTPGSNTKAESRPLEALMSQRTPLDITGQVNIDGSLPVVLGGFAAVYRTMWKLLPVAVKVLKSRNGRRDAVKWQETMKRRSTREIAVMSAISHPNIVRFYGFASDIDEFPAIVSEWCEHGSSADYLEQNKDRLSEEMRFTLDVAEGLAYLHSLNVVHGDLKPANVLVDGSGVAKLCDFGLVRLVEWRGPAGMTTTSPYGGTILYNAYELFASRDNPYPLPSFASDIYALGCVSHEFILLKPPFQYLDYAFELFEAVKEGKPPATKPTVIEDESTSLLWDLLGACWMVDPWRRPNARDAVDSLDQIHTMRYQTTTIYNAPSSGGFGIGDNMGEPTLYQQGAIDTDSASRTFQTPHTAPGNDNTYTEAEFGVFSTILHIYHLVRNLILPLFNS